MTCESSKHLLVHTKQYGAEVYEVCWVHLKKLTTSFQVITGLLKNKTQLDVTYFFVLYPTECWNWCCRIFKTKLPFT